MSAVHRALALVAVACVSSLPATADHVVYASPPPSPPLPAQRTFPRLDALPLSLGPSPCLGGVNGLHARLAAVEASHDQSPSAGSTAL